MQRFLTAWLALGIEDGYHYITDEPSKHQPNWPHFMEHRHDQSILSVLIKTKLRSKVKILRQEVATWDAGGQLQWNNEMPLVAMRIKE
jgi:hypothetical protein